VKETTRKLIEILANMARAAQKPAQRPTIWVLRRYDLIAQITLGGIDDQEGVP
jgi:hypothetical protein